MTALAPLPGQEEASGEEIPAPARSDVSLADGTDVVDLADGTDVVDLATSRGRPDLASDPAARASWVFGLALALLAEDAPERVVMAEVLSEAAGHPRALEGAYGRAVALMSEFPDGTLVHRTVDLLAKALLRSRRPERAEEA